VPAGLLAFLRFGARRSDFGLPEAGPRAPLPLLPAAFAAQVFVLATVAGPGVYPGSAFGFRQLTESLVLLAPGLAWCLDRAGPLGFRLLVTGCWLAVLWNLLLIGQHHYGFVAHRGSAGSLALLAAVWETVGAHPLVGLLAVAGSAMPFCVARGGKTGRAAQGEPAGEGATGALTPLRSPALNCTGPS
jgi:hypothetical protein